MNAILYHRHRAERHLAMADIFAVAFQPELAEEHRRLAADADAAADQLIFADNPVSRAVRAARSTP